MTSGEVFLLVMRWLHLVSAALWVGGSAFFLLVLRPQLRANPDAPGILAGVATEFRSLVNLSIAVLIATGAVLAFDRLTSDATGAPYAVTLAVKSALTVWMFLLVQMERRRSRTRALAFAPPAPAEGRIARARAALSGYNAVVVFGIVVFGLSDLLGVLFEQALR